MKLSLSFEFAGISWLVTADVNDAWELEQVLRVEVYDSLLGSYKTVTCQLQAFAGAMQDQLSEAIADERQAAKDFWADNAFERTREEGKIKKEKVWQR